jgi:carboxyl-terminal processing protease
MLNIRKGLLAILLIVALLVGAGGVLLFQDLNKAGVVDVGNTVEITRAEYDDYQHLIDTFGKADSIRNYILDNYYIELDPEEITAGMYYGLFDAIGDPYSYYMNPSEYANFQISSTGSYSGVGITMSAHDSGYVVVQNLTEDAPAISSGQIKVGDYIYKVDGTEYSAKELDQCAAAVRGKAGTKVTITFLRDGQSFDVTLTRAKITTKTVKYSMIEGEDKIGYIKLSGFESASAADFAGALAWLKAMGAQSFVLDLRDNPGGLVSVCEHIADQLIGQGTLYYTEDHDGNREYSTLKAGRTDLKYVVLVNENSASCSEILAAGIQDNDEAELVGTVTYGKGIIQSSSQLTDGSAIKLTMWQYFSPAGKQIHKNGVSPNYIVELTPECYDDEGNLVKDLQLDKALELLR